MKKVARFSLFLICVIIATSCSTESCKLHFQKNSKNYEKVVSDIANLNLKMTSDGPSTRVLKTITNGDEILDKINFPNLDFVECYEDSTVIFQAKNCTKGSALKDDIFILVYAPNGKEHILQKRNVRNLKKVEANWFEGYHVLTLAN